MKIKAALCCVFLAILFFIANFSAAQTIKIPYVSISGFQAPLYLGERAGLFKKNQLDAQLIYMPGGSLIVQTLLSGDVGVASSRPPPRSALGPKAPSSPSSPAALSGR